MSPTAHARDATDPMLPRLIALGLLGRLDETAPLPELAPRPALPWPSPSPVPLPELAPSPEPLSLEWLYRLGDDEPPDADDPPYTLAVPGCGVFRGYYRAIDATTDPTRAASAMCADLTPRDDGLPDNRCTELVVRLAQTDSVRHATCATAPHGACVLQRLCDPA